MRTMQTLSCWKIISVCLNRKLTRCAVLLQNPLHVRSLLSVRRWFINRLDFRMEIWLRLMIPRPGTVISELLPNLIYCQLTIMPCWEQVRAISRFNRISERMIKPIMWAIVWCLWPFMPMEKSRLVISVTPGFRDAIIRIVWRLITWLPLTKNWPSILHQAARFLAIVDTYLQMVTSPCLNRGSMGWLQQRFIVKRSVREK